MSPVPRAPEVPAPPAGRQPPPRVGCDVVDVARLARVLERRPALRERVFTSRELDGARRGGVAPGSATEVARLAARWAAKEATRKALGDLRLSFHAVEVVPDPDGAPRLHLEGRLCALTCSLTHDGGVAMAVVLAPPEPDDARPGAHACC